MKAKGSLLRYLRYGRKYAMDGKRIISAVFLRRLDRDGRRPSLQIKYS
jgi:hypothetical protein